MSTHISVFCRDQQPLSVQAIIEQVKHGVFFDAPSFDPASGTSAASSTDWQQMQITYQPNKRPVVIMRYVDQTEVEQLRQETAARLGEAAPATLQQHIAASRQVFVVEIDAWGATEDAWAMSDSLEAFLARTHDGIVAADEGFYDQRLQPIYQL